MLACAKYQVEPTLRSTKSNRPSHSDLLLHMRGPRKLSPRQWCVWITQACVRRSRGALRPLRTRAGAFEWKVQCWQTLFSAIFNGWFTVCVIYARSVILWRPLTVHDTVHHAPHIRAKYSGFLECLYRRSARYCDFICSCIHQERRAILSPRNTAIGCARCMCSSLFLSAVDIINQRDAFGRCSNKTAKLARAFLSGAYLRSHRHAGEASCLIYLVLGYRAGRCWWNYSSCVKIFCQIIHSNSPPGSH